MIAKKKIVLIGAGGHCKSCIDVIEHCEQYEIIGIIDTPEKLGEKVLGYEVIGNDDDYQKFNSISSEFLITVGQIKSADVRTIIYEKLMSINAKMATIISPLSYVSPHATVETGTIVMHNVFVNAGARIGKNCILNSGCQIEHDAKINDHCHISTGALLNGGCIIGSRVFIGSNATISNHIVLEDGVVVGTGTVVIKNVERNSTVVGIPAKKIR